MRLEYSDLLGEITALDKLIEAQSELVQDLKHDLTNDARTLSGEMMQLQELSEQIKVLRHLRQTLFELEGKSFLLRSEQLRPMLEREAS